MPSRPKCFRPRRLSRTVKLIKLKAGLWLEAIRQNKSLYEDKEISSPTVALTSVLIMAAFAAKEGKHVMALDHKAAYLNATMEGPTVEMLISPGVAQIICDIDASYKKFIRADKKIAVRLKKALYGCVQSAMLL